MEKAKILRELHAKRNWPLLLPNAWDAASARIFEDAGFPAVATTSAGVAYALGYPDGQRVPAGEMIKAIARIVRAVRVPVTADVEAGYGSAAETARALIEVGAVGMNLEDAEGATLVPLDEQVARNRSVRAAAPEIVINARTDIFLAQHSDASSRLERTIERLRAFVEAGADSVFVPGVRDAETIGKLVRAVDVPLNILAGEGTPPVAELKRLGVGRITIRSGGMRATLALTRRIAMELRDLGTYEAFTRETIPYAEVNKLFER